MPAEERTVQSVLFTDIAASTERAAVAGDRTWRRVLDRHDTLTRAAAADAGGRVVKSTGDGFLLLFASPSAAVACGLRVVQECRRLDLPLRAGVHTGECEFRADDVAGIGVHVAARIMELAEPGEVLVSSTVRDLAAGADLSFRARGAHALRGVPGRWRLYDAAERTPAAAAPARTRRTPPAAEAAAPRRGAGGARPRTAQLLLVDDHPLWRQTLRTVLERAPGLRVVAEADDGEQACELAAQRPVDVVVMDMDLPVLHGLQATERIAAEPDAPKVLVLSSSDDRAQVLAAVRAGAAGYLLKTARSADIVDAVRRIHDGELVFPPALSEMVLAELRSPTRAAWRGPLRVRLVGGSALDRTALASLFSGADGEISAGDAAGDVTVAVLPCPIALDELAGPVLVLADGVEPAVATALLGRPGGGATGYLLADRVDDPVRLVETLRRVAGGESVVDPEVTQALLRRDATPLAQLTERERAVLDLMAQGRSNQAIGQRLHVSEKTVETHVSAVFAKLGLTAAPHDHRRVLAVLTYLGSLGPADRAGPGAPAGSRA